MRSAVAAAYSALAARASRGKANSECYTPALFRGFLFCGFLLALAIFATPAQAPSQRVQDLQRQAQAQAAAGDWAAAIASYDEELRISPHNLIAEIELAQAYRGVHNYDEAKRILERAHTEHPQSAGPFATLGDLDIEMQAYDAAIAHLRAALVLAPSDVESRNRLAVAYQAKGDLDNALQQVAKILARDPKSALGYYTRAKIYSDRNQGRAAPPDAMKVGELYPQNPRGRLLLGKILLRAPQGEGTEQAKERCQRAIATLEPLLEMSAQDSETLFLISRAYDCAGNPERAQAILTEFEKSSKNDRETKENQTQAKHLVQQANALAM